MQKAQAFNPKAQFVSEVTQNQKGQTFILVLMIMFVALTVGITASSRFVRSLHSIVASDDATKALGVAESAMGRLLLQLSDILVS